MLLCYPALVIYAAAFKFQLLDIVLPFSSTQLFTFRHVITKASLTLNAMELELYNLIKHGDLPRKLLIAQIAKKKMMVRHCDESLVTFDFPSMSSVSSLKKLFYLMSHIAVFDHLLFVHYATLWYTDTL